VDALADDFVTLVVGLEHVIDPGQDRQRYRSNRVFLILQELVEIVSVTGP
jgi:hypothetical protein